MPRDADFMLTPQERQTRARKRRARWLIILGVVLALGIGAVAARPTRDAIKGWQARRQAEKAFALIEQEKWKEAQEAAVAAYQLRPTEPQALRALARFFSRVRQPQAREFWDKLKQRQALTPADLRDEAAIALAANDQNRAEAAIKTLTSGSAGTAADWLLAAQLALQKGAAGDAKEALQKIFSDTQADARTELQAALLVLASSASTSGADADAQARTRDAWARVEKIAASDTAAGLEALVVLARQLLTRPADAPKVTTLGPPELSGMIERHPLANAAQKLLALDLRIQAEPSQRDALIGQGVEQWRTSDATSLATLAAWLNGKSEFQLHLESIPLETALQSQDLFLQHVDALGALGRWDDIRKLLEAERFPLDPVIQQMYLARCHLQLGHKTAAENSWQRAIEAAAGDVRKLMTVAQYAEKNGANAMSETAYSAAISQAPTLRAAWEGRLRATYRTLDTKQIHAVLVEMLKIWPNDPAVQNDEAYMRLLLMPASGGEPEELERIEELARRLMDQNPTSLPHRTLLALARLRQGRSDAYEAYRNMAALPASVTPGALAVHTATLMSMGRIEEARKEAAGTPSEALLPEERSLNAEALR